MRRVKVHQRTQGCGLLQCAQPCIGENAGQKVLAYEQVFQASFVFHGPVVESF